jgi:hypothetical protein
MKCNVWRLAVRYDTHIHTHTHIYIYIYIYIYVIRRLKVKRKSRCDVRRLVVEEDVWA